MILKGRKRKSKVSVIIPAFNESKTIRKVVLASKKVDIVDEIVVVDDGSTDSTINKIKNLGIKIIRHDTNRGKGAAMKTGLRNSDGDIVLFIDADLKNITPNKIRSLIRPVWKNKADFTKSRLKTKRGRLTKLLVMPLMKFLFPDMHFGEAISGQYCGRRNFFEKINIENDYGVDIGILLNASKRNLRMKEVNIGRTIHKEKSLDDLRIIAEDVARTILKEAGAIKKRTAKLKQKSKLR